MNATTFHTRATPGATPSATVAAVTGYRPYIKGIYVYVDTAGRTLTVTSGGVTLFTLPGLGTGAHIFPLPEMPGYNLSEALVASLDAGTTQQVNIWGFHRSI